MGISFLVLCFSLLEIAFTVARAAYQNANSECKMPWASPIQTYYMKIGASSCSVFMVSPTVGITAAHCFNEITLTLTSLPEVAATPKLIQTHLPGSLYAANSVTEISKIERAFITSLYVDNFRRVERNGTQNQLFSEEVLAGDFAFIRINPKIEIHEEVLFASDRKIWPFAAQVVAAGCKRLGDGNPEPRCCIMQMTYICEFSQLLPDEAFMACVSRSKNVSKPEMWGQFSRGFSGGPVTIDDENGKKHVAGIYLGSAFGIAVVIRLNRYVALIKDLITADEATLTDQSRGVARYADEFIEIEFKSQTTSIVPYTPPKYWLHRILYRQLPMNSDG